MWREPWLTLIGQRCFNHRENVTWPEILMTLLCDMRISNERGEIGGGHEETPLRYYSIPRWKKQKGLHLKKNKVYNTLCLSSSFHLAGDGNLEGNGNPRAFWLDQDEIKKGFSDRLWLVPQFPLHKSSICCLRFPLVLYITSSPSPNICSHQERVLLNCHAAGAQKISDVLNSLYIHLRHLLFHA